MLLRSFNSTLNDRVSKFSQLIWWQERRVRRQKSANSEHHSVKPETPKSLSARYAELLKLREAVSKTQSNLDLSAGAEANGRQGKSCAPLSLGLSTCSPLLAPCSGGHGCSCRAWLGRSLVNASPAGWRRHISVTNSDRTPTQAICSPDTPLRQLTDAAAISAISPRAIFGVLAVPIRIIIGIIERITVITVAETKTDTHRQRDISGPVRADATAKARACQRNGLPMRDPATRHSSRSA